VVKPGRILFEIKGVAEDVAREAMRLAIAKLPIAARVVTLESQGIEKAAQAVIEAEKRAAAEAKAAAK